MPELGPMMRALELQRVIEDKVTEWRKRSARVAGATVADSYHQPHNFKRHTNRRKNSAEINRIIAKYSRPNKSADERHSTALNQPPKRPERHKKLNSKVFSKSEDNLVNVGAMSTNPDPAAEIRPPPRRFSLSKYQAKSVEDVTAFVDMQRAVKSKNFEPKSILNSKTVNTESRPKLHSICEDTIEVKDLSDSGIEIREKTNFLTSTPISKRKTCSDSDSVSVVDFQNCKKYNSEIFVRRGSSEPDILSVSSIDTLNSKTLDSRKRWKLLKPNFKKGTFDCILKWRGKKTQKEQSR